MAAPFMIIVKAKKSIFLKLLLQYLKQIIYPNLISKIAMNKKIHLQVLNVTFKSLVENLTF